LDACLTVRDNGEQKLADERRRSVQAEGILSPLALGLCILRLADDFNVLSALCGQHQPRVCHSEQGAFAFGVTGPVGKVKAFGGVQAILLYACRHASDPPN